MEDSSLLALLRARLSPDEKRALQSLLEDRSAADYDAVLQRVLKRAPILERQVERNRRRVEKRYLDLVDLPAGRVQTILDNCPAQMLVALTRKLIEQSFEARFGDPRRTRRLAELALQVAKRLRGRPELGPVSQADLEAEAWMYLGNALRLSSQLGRADRAFQAAEILLHRGSGERDLKATFLDLQATLRFSQGRSEDATEMLDRVIRLRRLLGNRDSLGRAHLSRGWVASWDDPLETLCAHLHDGVERVEDPALMVLALEPLAERLARDGHGLQAWKVLFVAQIASSLLGEERLSLRFRWIKGIAHRAMGELATAVRCFREVREGLVDDGSTFKVALVSLDLAAALAAQGKTREVRRLAEEAHTIFVAEGLERRALAAFLAFYRAARAETLTEELAVRVANLVAVHRHNQLLRLETTPAE